MRPRIVRLLTLAAVLAVSGTVSAYLKIGGEVNGRSVLLHWAELPIRYFVTDSGVSGVVPAQLDETLSRAAASWQQVPTTTVRFERAGFVSAAPSTDDGMSVIGFESRPELDRVLGATSYTFDVLTGEILEADIFFNSAFPWSVASNGEPNRFDLESIALHEMGHMLGLGHSALGETELQSSGRRRLIGSGAVMFPIAFPPGSVAGRTLQADDRAGVSDLYPAPSFRRETGSISGRVTLDGRGLPFAHVVAFNLTSGALVANFTLGDEGRFVIAGIEPGPVVLRVEPLDDGDLESFVGDEEPIETGFAVTFPERLIVVPEGGNAGDITIEVERR